MSPQTPPTDKKFAKDVAVQLDKVTRRRRRVRRLLLLALLAAAIALAIMYLQCGSGFGFGGGKGKGDGDGTGSGSVQQLVESIDAAPARCAVRVAAAGITVDGVKATKEQAVTTCKSRPGADITVTGGANQGTFDELRAAFVEAKIAFTILDASSGGRGSGSGSGSAR